MSIFKDQGKKYKQGNVATTACTALTYFKLSRFDSVFY